MTQRGLIPISLIVYGVIAAVAIGAVWWFVDEWQEGQEAKRLLLAAQAEVTDCPADRRKNGVGDCIKWVKENLADCTTKYGQALESIQVQNAAVAKLEEASKKALERSQAARKEADKAHVATRSERERLARLQANFKATTKCEAGEAVKSIREGLKP